MRLDKSQKLNLMGICRYLYISFFPLVAVGNKTDQEDFTKVVNVLRGFIRRYKLEESWIFFDPDCSDLDFFLGRSIGSTLAHINHIWQNVGIGGSKGKDSDALDELEEVLIGFLRRHHHVCTAPLKLNSLGDLTWHCEEREGISILGVLTFQKRCFKERRRDEIELRRSAGFDTRKSS